MTKRLIRLWAMLPLGLLIVGCVLVWKHYHPKPVLAVSTPTVVLSAVQVRDVPVLVNATATLQANQETTITAKLAGYIKTVSAPEGTFVPAGAVLVSLENTKEQQAYRSAQAEAALAKSTFERYAKLIKTGVISKQDYDQYQAKYATAVAAETSAARALQDTQLVAPFAGYLGANTMSVGNFINVGQALLTLTDSNVLRVKYTLPSRYATRVKVGQAVQITQDFLPGQVFTAQVSFISPTVDEQTQTLEVHANLDNHKQALKPGQSVNVRQTLGVDPQALLVPTQAVMVDVNGSYVYRLNHSKVEQVMVTSGEPVGDDTVILKGLTAQDQIITQGQFNVHPGQLVNVAPKTAR